MPRTWKEVRPPEAVRHRSGGRPPGAAVQRETSNHPKVHPTKGGGGGVGWRSPDTRPVETGRGAGLQVLPHQAVGGGAIRDAMQPTTGRHVPCARSVQVRLDMRTGLASAIGEVGARGCGNRKSVAEGRTLAAAGARLRRISSGLRPSTQLGQTSDHRYGRRAWTSGRASSFDHTNHAALRVEYRGSTGPGVLRCP